MPPKEIEKIPTQKNLRAMLQNQRVQEMWWARRNLNPENLHRLMELRHATKKYWVELGYNKVDYWDLTDKIFKDFPGIITGDKDAPNPTKMPKAAEDRLREQGRKIGAILKARREAADEFKKQERMDFYKSLNYSQRKIKYEEDKFAGLSARRKSKKQTFVRNPDEIRQTALNFVSAKNNLSPEEYQLWMKARQVIKRQYPVGDRNYPDWHDFVGKVELPTKSTSPISSAESLYSREASLSPPAKRARVEDVSYSSDESSSGESYSSIPQNQPTAPSSETLPREYGPKDLWQVHGYDSKLDADMPPLEPLK